MSTHRSDSTQHPAPAAGEPARRNRKRIRIAITLIVLVIASLVTLALIIRGGDTMADSEDHAAHRNGTTTGGDGLAARDFDGDGIVYQSGMHPWIVEDEPGKCPICGMDLMPVNVGGSTTGDVTIDPATLQNIGVRMTHVHAQSISRTLRATGIFEVNERARQAVSLKIGGWIERLYLNAEGDRVRAGQPLLELYSPQLVSTQEEYLLALRHRALMGKNEGDRIVEAARRRLLLFDVSAEQIARLEQTGEVQRTLTIHAPASGTIVDKVVIEGQQVNPGTTLMHIVDLSRLWLQVAVPEQDLAWVRPGTRVSIELESNPGQVLTGQVEHVYDTLDPATRKGTARVTVGNPGHRLKPGMYAVATLAGAPSEAHPTVPSEALIRTAGESVVFVALGEGRFRPQTVVPGIEADGQVQILSGLHGGEMVVTSAQFLIDSEARLAAAVSAMMNDDSGGDAHGVPDEIDHSLMNH